MCALPEHRYRAYGLTIRSTILLPELAPGSDAGDADVEITIGRIPAHLGTRVGPNVSGTRDNLYFGPQQRAAFWVRDGTSIVVQPAADVPPATVRPFILGSGMAAVLHQRAFLPLHASAVTSADGCIAFVGERGSGKSTTAAYLATQGRGIIADDICAIALCNGRPLASPNFQRQRLHDDAADHFGASRETSYRLDAGKLAVPVADSAGDAPRAVRAVFVLADAPVAKATRLSDGVAVQALLMHTFRPRHIVALGNEQVHMRRCAQVIASTPVYSLERPRDLRHLSEIRRVLEACGL